MRRVQEEKDRQNSLLDIVAPVRDPERRRQIRNRIRFIDNHERIRKLTKNGMDGITNQKDRLTGPYQHFMSLIPEKSYF